MWISWDEIRGNANGVLGDVPPSASSFLGKLQHGVTNNPANAGLSAITFDLPTEAQWEIACRAGTAGSINNTNTAMTVSIDLSMLSAHPEWAATLNEVAWWMGNSAGYPQASGLKRVNKAGLYDMHGNVYEWCRDRWNGNVLDAYNPNVSGNMPVVSGSSTKRSIRGGYASLPSGHIRSAVRASEEAGTCASYGGFRLVGFGAVAP
jgi:formylglycine-generating enzyme required for sulfatase activity